MKSCVACSIDLSVLHFMQYSPCTLYIFRFDCFQRSALPASGFLFKMLRMTIVVSAIVVCRLQ